MIDDVENDDLWMLLGQAKAVVVSPYFSRRVLRDIRLQPQSRAIPSFLLRWLSAGAFALLITGFFVSLSFDVPASFMASYSPEFLEAFDVAAGLDTLVAVEDAAISAYANGL